MSELGFRLAPIAAILAALDGQTYRHGPYCLHLDSASKLGLTVPASPLARADEVID